MAATTWSATSGYMAVGISLSWRGNPADGWVWVDATYTLWSDSYGFNYDSTLHRSGFISGDVPVHFYSPTNTSTYKTVKAETTWANLNYGESRVLSFSASLGPIFNGGNPSVTAYLTLPKRPYETPNTPTNVVASRANDSQANLSWTVQTTASKPVRAFAIERTSAASPDWVRVATLSSSARSWTDPTLKANDAFQYRVWASNGAVWSQAGESNWIYTTPTAPANVTAVKNASGSITVSWERSAPYDGTGFEVYDNGALVGSVSVVSGQTSYQWTHDSPSASHTHTYTVKHVASGVSSGFSAPSNTVQLLAAPNPPANLSPTGTFVPGNVKLSWKHSPVDSSAQTHAQLRYRVNSGEWTTLTIANGDQHKNVTFPAGKVEWQVRTWGAYLSGQESGASPWSAVSVLAIADKPGASITNPTASPVKVSRLTVGWSYYQAQSHAQAGATVTVSTRGGGVVHKAVINGAVRSYELPFALKNATEYTLTVVVRSGDGLYSNPASFSFTTDFPQPAVPTVQTAWDTETGATALRITNPTAESKPEVVSNSVERSIDNGVTWEIVAGDVPTGGSITDAECLSNGTTLYRVTAVTALPSSSSTTVSVSSDSQAMWLAGGSGFQTVVALAWDPKYSTVFGLVNRTLAYFAGRTHGVELSGRQRQRQISLSATLLDSSVDERARLEALAYLPAPFLYRDPNGNRVYCSMKDVNLSRTVGGLWSVSVSLEEVSK